MTWLNVGVLSAGLWAVVVWSFLGVRLLRAGSRLERLVLQMRKEQSDTLSTVAHQLDWLQGDIDTAVRLELCKLVPELCDGALATLSSKLDYYKRIEKGSSQEEQRQISRDVSQPCLSGYAVSTRRTPSEVLEERLNALKAIKTKFHQADGE